MLNIDAKKYVEYMSEVKRIKTWQIDAGYPWGTASIEEVTSSYNLLTTEIQQDTELSEEQKKELISEIEKTKISLEARKNELEEAIEKMARIPETEYKELLRKSDDYLRMCDERDFDNGRLNRFDEQNRNWEYLIRKLFGGIEQRMYDDDPSKHNVLASYYVFFTPEEINGILNENKDVLEAAYKRIKEEYPNIATDLADDITDITNSKEDKTK